MGKERRRVARHESNLFAEVETEDGKPLGRGVVTDVSLSGIALETEAELPVNVQLVCHIEMPLELRATVVRGTRVEAGVRLYGLRLGHTSFIEKFLIRRLLKGTRKTRKVNL